MKKVNPKILKLLNNYTACLTSICSSDQMIRATFSDSLIKCGKSNCWCAKEKKAGHRFVRIGWKENNISKGKAIPKEDAAWVKLMTENYRKVRKLRQELHVIEKEINSILNAITEEAIQKTRKLKDYL